MKLALALMLAAALVPESGARGWPDPGGWGGSAQDPLGEESFQDTVRLVGDNRERPQSPPLRTFSFGIGGFDEPQARAPAAPDTLAMPQEARWPDDQGRIRLEPDGEGVGAQRRARRNPWEVRERRASSAEETVVSCGGVITADDGECVALVNGSIVRCGAALGGMSVARITPEAVLLEEGAYLLVVPRGRRVTVVR